MLTAIVLVTILGVTVIVAMSAGVYIGRVQGRAMDEAHEARQAEKIRYRSNMPKSSLTW